MDSDQIADRLAELPLIYDEGQLRLRRRARWAGTIIALGTLLPYEVIEGNPQFLWDLFGELSIAGLLACMAPAVLGLSALIGSVVCKRGSSLALTCLAGFVTAAGLVSLGADAAAWDMFQLPDSVVGRPISGLLTLSLTAAGASLTFGERTRRVGHGLLIAAGIMASTFYLMPADGEAPITTVIRLLTSLDDLPHWRYKLGFVVIAVLISWPGLIALFGLRHLKVPAKDRSPMVGLVAIYGLPLMLTMLVFRAIPGGGDGWAIYMVAGGVAVLEGLVALFSSSIEVASESLLAPNPEHDDALVKGLPVRKAGLIALGVTTIALAAQAVLAMPPSKGVEWTLGEPTEAADELFEVRMPMWNRARLRWDRQARNASGSEALITVKRAARKMVDAATAIDPELGAALKHMDRASRDLKIAGRKWYRLVAEVNAATRAAGLPYYLDPAMYTFVSGGHRQRHFLMRTYRVLKVNQYLVDGDPYATIRVTRLDSSRGSPYLGFSRDLQPFALIDEDENADFETSLREAVGAAVPSCGSTWEPGMARCSQLLETVIKDTDDLSEALARITDRHELQHQIDGPHLELATLILENLHVGPKTLKSVNRELAAHLAQFSGEGIDARLSLIHVARHAILGRGGKYHTVAVLILGAMSGVDVHREDTGGEDPKKVVEAFELLADLPADTLAERATDIFEAQYGGMPEVVRLK